MRVRGVVAMAVGLLSLGLSVDGCTSTSSGAWPDAGVGTGGVAANAGASAGGGAGVSTGGQSSGGSTGFGTVCQSDKDCRPYNLLCDPSLGCVDCVRPEDCPPSDQGQVSCTAGRCEIVITCANSLDCPTDRVCDTASGECVECVLDTDCSGGLTCQNQHCARAVGCTTTSDCTPPELCDAAAGRCVECLSVVDCPSGQACELGVCVSQTGGCKPHLALLLQRSGAMFELPTIDVSWWNGLEQALVSGSAPLVNQISAQVDLSVLAFYRRTATTDACPLFHTAPAPADPTSVADLLSAARSAWTSSAEKIDAPVPEAIATAAAELGGGTASTPSFIVLVSTGAPDTCTVYDGVCGMDPTVAAVQAARRAGVTTLVLGLGADSSIQYSASPALGYTGYLAALANAGAGLAVAGPPLTCSTATAQYQSTGGTAPFEQALAPAEIAPDLTRLFARVLAACP